MIVIMGTEEYLVMIKMIAFSSLSMIFKSCFLHLATLEHYKKMGL